ncbi:GGDEF domain-containing protein [Caenispirillum bisanense]|uniref:diguanylate cyclase n=1 Tax=Caenispirillum bisanense TaxID=414052 RepID=A0A286G8A6_9PROT|nr:GGDEF domain-containing protein [Caenispirillum bisanense]SOD91780.1 diguanylate cyclase (GGDEF) domain-containing protein [Caenispirillum bisanense]
MREYPRRGGPPAADLGVDDPRHRSHVLVNRMYFAGFVLLGFFTLFDLFVTGYLVDATVEAVTLVLISILWLRLQRTGDLDGTGWAASAIAGVAILAVVLMGSAPDGVVAWVPLYPVVPFFLLGCRRGALCAGIYFVVVVGAFAFDLMPQAQGFAMPTVFNVGGALAGATAILYWYEHSRETAAAALRQAADTDFLTGVANRRSVQRTFDAEAARARRHGRPLSLLLVDLDHFKRINDTHGHEAGDAAIVHCAGLLAAGVRGEDTVGRIGGEEFAVLLPDTDAAGAVAAAEGLRQALEDRPVPWRDAALPLTASIGVAVLGPTDDFTTLFAAADDRLYAAKAGGRNRVVGPPPPTENVVSRQKVLDKDGGVR